MEGGEYRCWEDLLPDALGLIFSNLNIQDILTVIPLVCKSWNEVVLGPYCWQKINLLEWSYRSNSENIDRMLRQLVSRSEGAIREISVSCLQNEAIFSFIADHARAIKMLQIPRSNISDPVMEQVAAKLSMITFFDLSYCCKISAKALETIGKNCKSLVSLRRNMHPLDLEGKISHADEAKAIATTMPNLKHLEMAYLLIDTSGVMEILQKCPQLESLDVRGCWDVNLDEKWIKDKAGKVKIMGPHVVDDEFERNAYGWEDCSDYSDSLYYDEESLWDDEEERMGSLELRFYDDSDEQYSAYGWPTSP